MPLTTNKELLTLARKGGYAVGAFNINNLEILQAILSAAEGERSPAIIAVSEGAIQYAGMPYLISMVQTAAVQTSIPIALHLDHGKDLEVIRACIENGFTSVMIDGSEFEFEKNIDVTKKVVEMAKGKRVSVEAELGRLKGIEEKVSVSEKEAILTDPQAAEDFVKRTEVDALAIAIGTSALMAIGCQQYRICDTGKCPKGITTQDPELRARLNIEEAAKGLENFLKASTEELKDFARLTGNDDVHKLALSDLCTTNSEISDHTDIEHI